MRPDEALALLRRHRVMTLAPTAGVPSLVEAVAGGPVRGSWWGHPSGKDIYACAVAFEASDEVLCAKLVEGKVSFVHRALWAPLLRVLVEPARRPRCSRRRSASVSTRRWRP